MLELDYTRLDNIAPIPIIDFYFRNPNHPALSICNNCGIIDTGSDTTLISYGEASRLQLTALKTKDSANFRGLGRVATGTYFLIQASFDNKTYFRARVLAIPDDILNGEAIIGRNILNRYIIILNSPKLKLTISE